MPQFRHECWVHFHNYPRINFNMFHSELFFRLNNATGDLYLLLYLKFSFESLNLFFFQMELGCENIHSWRFMCLLLCTTFVSSQTSLIQEEEVTVGSLVTVNLPKKAKILKVSEKSEVLFLVSHRGMSFFSDISVFWRLMVPEKRFFKEMGSHIFIIILILPFEKNTLVWYLDTINL